MKLLSSRLELLHRGMVLGMNYSDRYQLLTADGESGEQKLQ